MKNLFVLLLSLVFIFLTTLKASIPSEGNSGEPIQFTCEDHVMAFLPEYVYLTGNDHMLKVTFQNANDTGPEAEQSQIPQIHPQLLEKVVYPELWDGISLIYEREKSRIAKSTYIISPDSDAGKISLRYNVPVRLDKNGNLLFEFETGTLSEKAPIAWQIINGKRFNIKVEFRLYNEKTVGFKVGKYNPAYRLIIDPSWEWNTFMGSWHSDKGFSITVDNNGNVYITGLSKATWGSPVNAFAGDTDVFAAKLNSNGELQWHTFLGGSDDDEGYGISVDGSGNVYIAGYSETTWGSPLNPYSGRGDVFVAKLNSIGVLQWHTFMGCADRDDSYGIAVDGSGNIYVTGSSESTWGSPVNAHIENFDLFVTKLNSSGTRQWHTFMGGTGVDIGRGITIGSSGNVYVAGYSYAPWGSPINTFAGYYDAFAAKLNNSGARQWHTFMGGSSWDYGMDIAVDGSDNVYVAGYSNTTWGSPVNPYTGSEDMFTAKLNSNGVIQWNTFIGGSSKDNGGNIVVDNSGSVFVVGECDATWGSPVNPYTGYIDVFAAKLDNSGVIQGTTFMGCSILDNFGDIALDDIGNFYITGNSGSTWGSPINDHAGIADAFCIKFEYSHIVNVEKEPGLPIEFMLSQNYPNPFNAHTLIKYSLPRVNHVTLKVYNIKGEEIKTLINHFQTQGNYAITFDADQLTSGIYLYELKIGKEFVKVHKMTLIK